MRILGIQVKISQLKFKLHLNANWHVGVVRGVPESGASTSVCTPKTSFKNGGSN